MKTHPTLSKECSSSMCVAFLVIVVILAQPGGLLADVWVAVDCSSGDSIQAAIDALPAPPPGQWNHIQLLSDCTENVSISGQHRLWLGSPIWWGSFPHVTITGVIGLDGKPVADVLSISGSQEVTIENLTLTGGYNGLAVGQESSVYINIVKAERNEQHGFSLNSSSLVINDGGAIGNGWNGINLSGNSSLELFGNTPWLPEALRQRFVISGNGGHGINVDRSVLVIYGGVTIEKNLGVWNAGVPLGAGIQSFRGTLVVLGWIGGENLIRGNPRGVSLREGAQMSMAGLCTVQNNDTVGVEVTEGSQAVFWTIPPDLPGSLTIENNPVAGVEVTLHGQADFHGHNKIRNNGSKTEQLRAGMRVDGTSQLLLVDGNEVTGNTGPGIFADINSSVEITDATIKGNTEEGVRVRHMSIAEILGETNLVGVKGVPPLTCDATSLVITSLITKSTACGNIEAAPGPKPRVASSLGVALNVEEMMQRARNMAERYRGRK